MLITKNYDCFILLSIVQRQYYPLAGAISVPLIYPLLVFWIFCEKKIILQKPVDVLLSEHTVTMVS